MQTILFAAIFAWLSLIMQLQVVITIYPTSDIWHQSVQVIYFMSNLCNSKISRVEVQTCYYKLILGFNWEISGKQAENGLQSRSSENGKTAVWHYGLKLQWFLTGDRDSRYGMVWYGFVGIVWYGGWCQMTSEFIHEEISTMDYNGLSWTIIEGGGVMTGMDDWHGWLA